MFASNIIVSDRSLIYTRGQDLLSYYSQSRTIGTGHAMQNAFCRVCGSLMYRASSGFPDTKILRLGTVDDFALHETKLKPRREQFVKDRVAWLQDIDGVQQVQGNFYEKPPGKMNKKEEEESRDRQVEIESKL